MELEARHGDLVIEKVAKLTGVLKIEKGIVFAGDSSGHRHRLQGAAAVRREGLVTFVRVDKDTKLVHEKPDGHRTIDFPAGSYEIRPLRERGGNLDRAVVD